MKNPLCYALIALTLAGALSGADTGICDMSGYEGIPKSTNFPVPLDRWAVWLAFDPDPRKPPSAANHRLPEMNVSEIRRHIWQLWAELTANSHSARSDVRGRLPRWETWFPAQDVLKASAGATVPLTKRLPLFEQVPELQVPIPANPGGSKFSQSVLYNRPVCSVVVDYGLGRNDIKKCLQTLADRSVPAFDEPESMALKAVWYEISADETESCPELPVWDNRPADPKSPSNDARTWPRNVQIRINPRQKCTGDEDTVDLDRFYYRKLERSSQILTVGEGPKSGYQILVGMHVITKEIPNWVWATFWWHDGALSGDSAFAADRKGIRFSGNVWRNYLMDFSVDMDRPWRPDGSPKVTFNPYIEAAFPDGTHSNCMSCHLRASWPPFPARATLISSGDGLTLSQIVVRGSDAAPYTYYGEADQVLNLRFLWSLGRKPDFQLPLLDDRPLATRAEAILDACPAGMGDRLLLKLQAK